MDALAAALSGLDVPTLAAFAPAVAYLLVVTGSLLVARRCPEWLHLAALAAGVPARVWVTGWADALLAVGLGVVLLVLGVLVTSRLLSGVTLFTLCTATALSPLLEGWVGLLGGLAMAAVVSVWRTVASGGIAQVNMLTVETMGAMGVLPGAAGKPNLDLLPTRAPAQPETGQDPEQDVDAEQDSGVERDEPSAVRAASRPMRLPDYLLTGVLAAAVLYAAL